MTRPPRTILWDNDGVLVDTEPLYYEASRSVIREAGGTLSLDDFIEVSLRRGGSVFDFAFPSKSGREKRGLRTERDNRYERLIERKLKIRAGIQSCLKAFKGKTTMRIVTSSRRRHFRMIHEKSGLLVYFDGFMTREAFHRSKPHPDSYQTALRKWNLKKENCLVVEDSERGVRSAAAAGLRVIAFPSALTKDMDFSPAEIIVSSAGALKNELKSRCGL